MGEKLNPEEINRIKAEVSFRFSRIDKIIIPTDPLKRTYAAIRMPVFINTPGCWLAAEPGEGKSTAIEYCARSLKAEFPGLPVFVINQLVLPNNELHSFFARALSQSSSDAKIPLRVTAVRIRLARYWSSLSLSSPFRRVILFIDECQAMRATDEYLLKDLSNEIVQAGGGLQTFCFGESPTFNKNVVANELLLSKSGAVDRLFGGSRIQLHWYEASSDWASLFKAMKEMNVSDLDGKSILQYLFPHLSVEHFNYKSTAASFHNQISTWNKVDSHSTKNVRRAFVAIRYGLLSVAMKSIDEQWGKIITINEDVWKEALSYGLAMDIVG